MTRSACFSKWLLLASLGIGACGSDASLLIIEVSSRPASVQSTLTGHDRVRLSLAMSALRIPYCKSAP